MYAVAPGPLTTESWMHYALIRIQELLDKPRAAMTDDELAAYRLATAALSGGEPVIPVVDRGAGRLCRVCGAHWGRQAPAAHQLGCPVTA